MNDLREESVQSNSQLNNGTISKVPCGDFTKTDIEFLWDEYNTTMSEFDQPKERYTRHLSELIKKLRDVTSKLIEAEAIPGYEIQDTAGYVRKQLKGRGVPISNHYYQYFEPDQKRDWQSDETKKTNSKHEHDWVTSGKSSLGIMKKCMGGADFVCEAIMIDGKLYEHTPNEQQDQELNPKKKIIIPPTGIMVVVKEMQAAADRLYDFAGVIKKNSQLYTEAQIEATKQDIFLINRAGEFLIKTAKNKKQLIDPLTMHLLVVAYAIETQNVAGGRYIMARLDLAERRHSEGVQFFTEVGQFAKLISEKQTKKAMEGKIKEVHQRYMPLDAEDAQDRGFSGQQCDNCLGYSVGYEMVDNPNYDKDNDPVHMKNDMSLMCYSCSYLPKPKKYKLPKQAPTISVTWDTINENNA